MIADAIGQLHPRAASGARIVSLVPSITELLFALDLGAEPMNRPLQVDGDDLRRAFTLLGVGGRNRRRMKNVRNRLASDAERKT